MPSPAELDLAATRCDELAAAVGTALDRVALRHGPEVWQGGRATRFGLGLEDQRAVLRAAAEQLTADARVLRARADLVRSTVP